MKWVFLLSGIPCLALSTFRGIQPGVSTRAEAERVLGAASGQRGADEAEYALSDKSGTVVAKYQSGNNVVEELEYRLAAALPRAEMTSLLEIPADAVSADANPQTTLFEEFFDGPHTLILVHVSASRGSAIGAIRYLSRAGYDRELARFQPQTPALPPAQDQPQAPPPPPSEQRVRYDPAACKDIYDWARAEVEPANKSKNPDRRQAIIEIRINAQRGDCGSARSLTERYRSSFK